jgi:hypothetical protein
MANEVIIKDSSTALQDADELVQKAKAMKTEFEELSSKMNNYINGAIRLEWMDQVVGNYDAYKDQEILKALTYIEQASTNIQTYVREALAYSKEENV